MTDEDVHALIVLEDNNKPQSYVGIITTIMIIAESWKYDKRPGRTDWKKSCRVS